MPRRQEEQAADSAPGPGRLTHSERAREREAAAGRPPLLGWASAAPDCWLVGREWGPGTSAGSEPAATAAPPRGGTSEHCQDAFLARLNFVLLLTTDAWDAIGKTQMFA